MPRTLELWIATLGMLVAGAVAIGWLAVMPMAGSRLDLALTVAMCTTFGWTALVLGTERRPGGHLVTSHRCDRVHGEIRG